MFVSVLRPHSSTAFNLCSVPLCWVTAPHNEHSVLCWGATAGTSGHAQYTAHSGYEKYHKLSRGGSARMTGARDTRVTSPFVLWMLLLNSDRSISQNWASFLVNWWAAKKFKFFKKQLFQLFYLFILHAEHHNCSAGQLKTAQWELFPVYNPTLSCFTGKVYTISSLHVISSTLLNIFITS